MNKTNVPGRKGARSVKEIPAEILQQLNAGKLETVNLVEWLAVDQRQLLQNILKEAQRGSYIAPVLSSIESLEKQTVNTINAAIGKGLLERADLNNDRSLLPLLLEHTADVARCWAAYMIGFNEKVPAMQRLQDMQALAADQHFGVREIAWMAVRHLIIRQPEESVQLLMTWVQHPDANVRRFCTEATRPRGVWCEHIEVFKKEPQKALPLLEALHRDEARYVQDSVGNWLNDASKSCPDFVTALCSRWEQQSDHKATKYILKKALRTLQK